ncbi:hypothetical protein BRPE64_DCDS00770 (plasmid) [Caballeronia insecticola]|uniref:Uncharacterized protein n=1 Tax=Caballeronia insecticola TaxID=758793 RepID=R4WQN9_9BURK|nr:hypothetical protein BRPE64_DCDS00770 [Caballeronia insecticola]
MVSLIAVRAPHDRPLIGSRCDIAAHLRLILHCVALQRQAKNLREEHSKNSRLVFD